MKHNYKKVLDELEQELRVIPQAVKDLAYAFRDVVVAHCGDTYKHKIVQSFPFKAGKSVFGGDSIYVKYKIVVESRTERVGHDYEDFQTLKIYLKSRFIEKDQWGPVELPWERKQNG